MNKETQATIRESFIKENQAIAWGATCYYAYYGGKLQQIMDGQKAQLKKLNEFQAEIKKIESNPEIVGKERYEAVKKLNAEIDRINKQTLMMKPMIEQLDKKVREYQSESNRAFDIIEFANEFELLEEKQKELTPDQKAENEKASQVTVEEPQPKTE